MGEVRIRRALPRDEKALAELDWLTWAPDNSVMPRPTRNGYFYDRFHLPEHFLVAELDDRVVGYLRLVQPVLQPSAAHVRQIQGLAVDPEARGRGIGGLLLEGAVAEARRQGARKLTLRVLAGNTAARRLYESLGFTVEGVLKDEFLIEGRLVDDVLMARFL
ncbi:GNAT family N-acetyltransferase [Actinocorallia populi]|uniref:GNAT family N-acetyltransferase n=1 Tax=Actinocorallia populi TaxID=2079200 RepID=UPI000D091C54|nr:GNAT family N-acetyltransferase [Actinocorallia populi]